MTKLKTWTVRHTKVWVEEWTAYTREEAIERAEAYHVSEGWLVETLNTTTAQPTGLPTQAETDEYLNPEQ